MKKVICVMAVLLVFLVALFAVDVAGASSCCVYGKLGVIVDFDYDEDLVFVLDWNGTRWSFGGIEDWVLWDYVDLVFSDNGTPETIYDDIILSATYERVDLVQAQVLELILNSYPQYK